MSKAKLEEPFITPDLRPSERDAIAEGLFEYNAEKGFPLPWVDLNFVLRDAAGGVIGGILADTNGQWCFIKGLWIASPHRRHGYGRALLQAAESEARARGCIGVYLDTYSFQARPFYEKQGYVVFGVLRDNPVGGAKYYLEKRLDSISIPGIPPR